MNKEEMTPEQAVLFNSVYLPAFTEKCAELGLSISDEESLSDALEIAACVKMANESNSGSLLKEAKEDLKKHLGLHEFEQKQAGEVQLQKTASGAAQAPETRAALLSMLR